LCKISSEPVLKTIAAAFTMRDVLGLDKIRKFGIINNKNHVKQRTG
jgi:hypothetical protein